MLKKIIVLAAAAAAAACILTACTGDDKNTSSQTRSSVSERSREESEVSVPDGSAPELSEVPFSFPETSDIFPGEEFSDVVSQ